jgi:hypothetical protein
MFFAHINAAAEQIRFKCMTSVKEYEITVKSSHTGDGVFSGKDVPPLTYVGYYTGVVENARKYADKGYSIGIPPIRFPDGTVVPALLCGYEQRMLQGNASMFNSSCLNFNAQFLFEDVFVRKNLEAHWEVQRLLEKKGSDIPLTLLDAASEIEFTYSVVIVMTNKEVKAGEEIRVTYNRHVSADNSVHKRVPYARKRHSGYFTPRMVAMKNATQAGKDHYAAKCMCEPGGCPLKRYFVTKKVAAAVVQVADP